MENQEKNTQSKSEIFENNFIKAFACLAAFALSVGIFRIGENTSRKASVIAYEVNEVNTVNTDTNNFDNSNYQPSDNQVSSTDNTANNTSNNSGNNNNANSSNANLSNTNSSSQNGAKSVSEIVSLYNESVNKVKPEAKKITRNYEHQKSDENYFEMPSAISGLAKTAMNMFIKGNDEPQVWTTKEDFKLGFPVSGEDYSSHLKPEMVKSATCKDNGSTYEIDIVLLDDSITNPKKGEGYAGVFTTVTADTITSANVPGVTYEKVNVNGIDGHITCTIDKASKHITNIVFTNTDVLDMSVKVLAGTLDAKFALACERSYTVEY